MTRIETRPESRLTGDERMYRLVRRVPHLAVLLFAALFVSASSLDAQTAPQAKPPASTQKPAARPSTAKPAAPATAKPPAPEVAAKPPAPPPPQDVRFKSRYSSGEMKSESVTYLKGERQRFEFQDMVLLRQPDQKRTIQISKGANTYLVIADGMSAMPMIPGAPPAAPPKPPGVIMVATTIVDTGERKTAFGQQARHVKLMIDKQPAAGACDSSRQRIETDGWYIDAPKTFASQPGGAPDPSAAAVPGSCA